jgi:hypothetical protein
LPRPRFGLNWSTAFCHLRPHDFLKCFQGDLPCPVLLAKIFRLVCRANQFYQLAPSFPGKRGGSRVVTDVGWDAVDAAALARSGDRRAGLSRERTAGARTNGASTPRPTLKRAAHGPLEMVEVAAYGEVVWSWHPLLMPSLAETRRPNRA